jgi:hypothetical protein
MIDDDDVEFAVLSWFPGGGWFVALLGLVVVVWMLVAVSQNKTECAQQHCEHGTPILANHECLCVERATPSSADMR